MDLDKAELDFWRVIDAEPENADAFAQLGYVQVCNGQAKSALSMLRRAVELAPTAQVEARSWLFHLRRQRGDAEAAVELEAVRTAAKQPDTELQWPLRIVEFLAGELSADDLVAKARSDAPSAAETAGRLCEAWLHVGITHRIAGRNEAAINALGRAVATDARDKWEWSWARRALFEICNPDL